MILLDNMTLLGAARALGIHAHASNPHAADADKKWDYELNASLQKVVDLDCLAQLCHAIVFHDEVVTMPNSRNLWGIRNSGASSLEDLIRDLDISPESHLRLVRTTLSTALNVGNTQEFNEYIALLVDEQAIGTFLRISNGYFGTGYSDRYLFSDLDTMLVVDNHVSIMETEIEALRRVLSDFPKGTSVGDAAHQRMVELSTLGAEAFRAQRLIDVPNRRTPLQKLNPLPGVSHELAIAYGDVLRNVAATVFYETIAGAHGAVYLPHPLRAPLTFAVDMATGGSQGGGFTPEALIRRMEFLRSVRIAELNRLLSFSDGNLSTGHIDIAFPFVFASVLREAPSLAGFVETLLTTRASDEATRIRKWFSDFRSAIVDGSLAISEIESELKRLRAAIAQWMHVREQGQGANANQISLGINVGFLAVSGSRSVQLPRPTLRRFRLIHELARASNEVASLTPEISRVFGTPTGEAWNAGRSLRSKLRISPSKSPLDLRK